MQKSLRSQDNPLLNVVHSKSKKQKHLEGFNYTPFYCEENIWQLCHHLDFAGKPGWVVFISNPGRKCAIWHAKLAGDSHQPVIWDYHVILLTKTPHLRVWDFDTRLGFPISPECYFNYSFLEKTPKNLQPRFKLVKISKFIDEFASDRSHMRGDGGEWLASPPDWPHIGQGRPSNLGDYADMTKDFGGRRYTLPALRKFLKLNSDRDT